MTNVDLSAESNAPGGSRNLRGYLATLPGQGPFPAVVMIHEAFGLDDMTRRHADRLARAGYLTLAVDLFSDGGGKRCLVATMRSMIRAPERHSPISPRPGSGWPRRHSAMAGRG